MELFNPNYAIRLGWASAITWGMACGARGIERTLRHLIGANNAIRDVKERLTST